MGEEKICIFCQSSGDIPYVLFIYEQNCEKYKINIFYTKQETYMFLSNLKLNSNLISLSYNKNFSIKNPINIIKEKRRIKKIYKQHFRDLRTNEIYFFSHIFDWLIYSFLGRIYKSNNLYLIDNYGYAKSYSIVKTTFKEKIILQLYKFVTGVKLNMYADIDKTSRTLGINLDYYNIEPKPLFFNLKTIWNKYQYNLNIKGSQKAVLFFESADDRNLIIGYEEKWLELIRVFNKNSIKIYIKPHPRLGFSPFLKGKVTKILPGYIPGEFLPVNDFIAVFGMNSLVIAKLSQYFDNVFCLINIFEYRKEEKKESYIKYLNKQSNDKIKLLTSIDSLKNLIK